MIWNLEFEKVNLRILGIKVVKTNWDYVRNIELKHKANCRAEVHDWRITTWTPRNIPKVRFSWIIT